ncbi:hypothetical protein B0186_01755 [Canicola haemoglobinophilus]|uniref:Transferrin-binding protein B C-lobe/N-lobe beta barrel domain-containing protein n=1 Tax=Canicola haemoglobinophilus TaxID=733 RepID=A0A1V4B387_9PAST|nr:hypothetical protein [Canicola haemoglobinophilus]OOS01798.1 hypothetical protein B0186_01755 [Canicola haemoglobinophilus]STO60692.1 Uncharacterised protein [Canicola haemoglobinophilus]
MNKHFKMTALAIVVSFGLTGCLTSNDSPADVKPATPIAKEEQGKPQTTPATKLEESKPTTKPEETKPQPEPEKIVNVDSIDSKWRIIKTNGWEPHDYSQVSGAGWPVRGIKTETADACNSPGICDQGNVLQHEYNVYDKSKFLNLAELSQQDGKPFLGLHSGSKTYDNLVGEVVDVRINEAGEMVTSKEKAKAINYLFINQPYSSYGMLYTNQNDISSFALGLSASEAGPYEDINALDAFTVYKVDDKTGKITWNDNVKGNATYKGAVIASVNRAAIIPGDHVGSYKSLREIPKVDGTITLNAHFGESWQDTYVSGELDSKLIGKVDLPKMNLHGGLTKRDTISKKLNDQTTLNGDFYIHFYGKDLNDVAGQMSLGRISSYGVAPNKGDITSYDAAFGGTKQPKSE